MLFCRFFGHDWRSTLVGHTCSLTIKEWPHTHKIQETCFKCKTVRCVNLSLGQAKSEICPSWFTHWIKKGDDMAEPGKRKQTVGDVTVDVHQCRHCKAWPTEEEIGKALEWREKIQPVCAICDRQLKYVHESISHDPEGDDYTWRSYGAWEPSVTLNSQRSVGEVPAGIQGLRVFVHLDCLTKAIPFHAKNKIDNY